MNNQYRDPTPKSPLRSSGSIITTELGPVKYSYVSYIPVANPILNFLPIPGRGLVMRRKKRAGNLQLVDDLRNNSVMHHDSRVKPTSERIECKDPVYEIWEKKTVVYPLQAKCFLTRIHFGRF